MNSTQDSTATQKSLFARYQEHITSAIFIGLVLGILTGLFLASRFDVVLTVTTLLGSIYMNALNMMIFRWCSAPSWWALPASATPKPPEKSPAVP